MQPTDLYSLTDESGRERVVRVIRAVWTAGEGDAHIATVVDVSTNEHFEVPVSRLRKLDRSPTE